MLHSWGKLSNHEEELNVKSLLTKEVGLDTLLSSLPCGAVCSVYENGAIPFVDEPLYSILNDALLDIFEAEEGTIKSSKMGQWIHLLFPEDEHLLKQSYADVMQTGETKEILCNIHLNQYKVVKASIVVSRLSSTNDQYTLLTTIPNPNSIYTNDRHAALRVQLDPMTGLFNKVAMEQIVKKRMETNSLATFFMGVIDVDNFKNVNDMLGHLFGDEVIQDVANVISSQAPQGSFIGRVGGDEFLVYADQCTEEDFVEYLHSLCTSAKYEYVCDEGIVSATCSIGYVEGQMSTDFEYEEYFHNADIAMYYAKQKGKAQFYKYDSKMRLKRRASDNTVSDGLNQMRDKQYDAEFVATAYGLLSDSKRIGTSIEMLLRKIGERFSLKSLRVFEWIPEADGYQVHFGWSKVQRKNFYKSDELMRSKWIARMYSEQSVIAVNDYGQIRKHTQEQLFQVVDNAFVATNLMHNVEIHGFICFESHEQKKDWTAFEIATFEALTKAIATFIFLDKEKQKDRKIIEQISKTDEITGLLKKNVFENSVKEFLKYKSASRIYGMLYLDICKFSLVNERFGYENGNKVLKKLAEQLTDYSFVKYASRSHSDCFVLLVEGEDKDTMMTELEAMISESLSKLSVLHHSHILQLKAGIYFIKDHTTSVETMIENANLARMHVFSEDDKFIQIYKEDFRDTRNKTIQINAEFFDKLGKNELMLYFQPVFRGEMNHCESVEAYAYWTNEEGTLRSPKDFIPALEKSGNMEKLDYAVYEMVLKQLNDCAKNGMHLMKVGVNFSISSCERYGFSTRIRRMARQYQVDPSFIQIELSMKDLKDSSDVMENELMNLSRQGFSIVVDHFETGFDMIKILDRPWLDMVKLDRKLFDKSNNRKVQSWYMSQLKAMIQDQDKVVVIGVETSDQLLQIHEMGFENIQGFVYEKAIPAELFFTKYLEKESVI